jgi:hypothetical protein
MAHQKFIWKQKIRNDIYEKELGIPKLCPSTKATAKLGKKTNQNQHF